MAPDTKSMTMHNVIVFGESGVGKSSVVNMLQGEGEAPVSDQAIGVTLTATPYKKQIEGKHFTIFDTSGLNEGSYGSVQVKDAVERLYRLIDSLRDGVSLLIYVIRASRITQSSELNYKLFFKIICEGKVPIVIAITGLENRDNMDEWWSENEKSFKKYSMKFQKYACITATKGRLIEGRYPYQAQYDLSKRKVEQLILESVGEAQKMEPVSWLLAIIDKFIGLFETNPSVRHKQVAQALHFYGGMSGPEAKAEAKRIEKRRITEEGSDPNTEYGKWTDQGEGRARVKC